MKVDNSYLKYLGVPYKFNGASMEGFDCINICIQMAKDRGVKLMNINHSHTSIHTYHYLFNLRDSKEVFKEVPAQSDVLVVFRVAGKISHVGYMLDSDKFIHILEGSNVTVESIHNITWKKRVVGFYKYIGD